MDFVELVERIATYQAKRKMEWMTMPASELIELDREIERLEARRQKLLIGDLTDDKVKKGRSDAMTAEIKAALKELGDDRSPNSVMRVLKRYAGKDGSVIKQVVPEGVLWTNPSGQSNKLTMAILKKRLQILSAKGL